MVLHRGSQGVLEDLKEDEVVVGGDGGEDSVGLVDLKLQLWAGDVVLLTEVPGVVIGRLDIPQQVVPGVNTGGQAEVLGPAWLVDAHQDVYRDVLAEDLRKVLLELGVQVGVLQHPGGQDGFTEHLGGACQADADPGEHLQPSLLQAGLLLQGEALHLLEAHLKVVLDKLRHPLLLHGLRQVGGQLLDDAG